MHFVGFLTCCLNKNFVYAEEGGCNEGISNVSFVFLNVSTRLIKIQLSKEWFLST